MFARDDTNNKCRVRIAHAFHPSLKIRVRNAHPTSVCSLRCSPGPRPPRRPPGHSRVGGNPYGTSLHGALVSFEDGYPANAQWIPAFAGMRGWPRATRGMGRASLSTGMPVKAVSMRLSRHALPGARLDAAPGKATNKCGSSGADPPFINSGGVNI